MFYQIFRIMSDVLGIPFDDASFRFLVKEWYQKTGRTLQSVHPRDILRIVRALCEYEGTQLHMTPQLIQEACENYFVMAEGEQKLNI